MPCFVILFSSPQTDLCMNACVCSVPVCVLVCTCVCVGGCICTCMYIEARCWCQVLPSIVPQLIFLSRGLSLNQMLSGWIDCLTSERWGYACLCLPHVKVIVSHDYNWYFVVGPHACMTEILLTELISMTQLLLTSHLHFLPFPSHPPYAFCCQSTLLFLGSFVHGSVMGTLLHPSFRAMFSGNFCGYLVLYHHPKTK